MQITNHVTSLELSRRLKELKVPQKSYFEWVDEGKDGSVLIKREYLHLPLGVKKYSAYLASELGELLPYKITSEQINKAYPMPKVEDGTDEELIALEEASEKLRDVFKDLELESSDQFDYGMPYDIKRDYHTGTTMRYWQQTDDWECNYAVIEISGDTEADCRAKMLIYLIENHLISVEELGR